MFRKESEDVFGTKPSLSPRPIKHKSIQKSALIIKSDKFQYIYKNLFKWKVMVSGELMFLESYDNCDVTNTVILVL